MRFAYAFYAVAFILLVYVEFLGEIGMGAQRWINLGFMQLQPSEMMKIALVLQPRALFPRCRLGGCRQAVGAHPADACWPWRRRASVMKQPDLRHGRSR